jgi:glycerophosphoryl diester phosphodiesterase
MKFWKDFEDKSNLVIAHRGSRSWRAENTMSAFEHSVGKCDFVEFDVGFSLDGVAVIIHDDTLERTSNVKDLPNFHPPYHVSDYTYEELLKLDFSTWFLKEDPFLSIKNGIVQTKELEILELQKILTLKELLGFLKENNLKANVEIKDMRGTRFDAIATQEVLRIIRETGMENMVIISSFNHDYLLQVHKLAPSIATAALQEDEHPKNLVQYLKGLHVTSYHPDFAITTQELVKELNEAGIIVNVFTVNKKEDIQKLFSWGVKGVFTDFL